MFTARLLSCGCFYYYLRPELRPELRVGVLPLLKPPPELPLPKLELERVGVTLRVGGGVGRVF